MSPYMRFPWNLIDRYVCLHCWAGGRYAEPGTEREPMRESFRCARRCAKENRS